ncbi:MAG: thioesterase family protein [Rikenellaceae bacterium]
MYKSEVDIQIRFADVDSLHHVNNVNIYHYFDIGKRDFLSAVLDLGGVFGKYGLVQANINTNFYVPVFINDEVSVTTKLSHIGNKSFVLFQEVVCKKTGLVKCDSKATMVCFNTEKQLAEEMTAEWRSKLEKAL